MVFPQFLNFKFQNILTSKKKGEKVTFDNFEHPNPFTPWDP